MKLPTKPLIFLAIPTAAFLTFIAQPILGKILTPRYGGSAGTWMTTSLFFQCALLLGYACAFWLLRKPNARTHRIVIALSLLAPLITIIPPLYFKNLSEIPAILFGLILSLGPMLILTTSIGILIQGWVARDEGTIPYYLYGVSNIGSAAALFAYPLWIERHITLSTQVLAVRLLLAALGLLAALLAWIYARKLSSSSPLAEKTSAAPGSETPDEKIPRRTLASWVFLSFSTCTIMLAAIRLLSSEFGSSPFSWVLPLSVYLLSFTLTFTRWWPSWLTTVGLVALGGGLFGYAATKGFSNIELSKWPLTWLLVIVTAACLGGHSLLYQIRPARRFPLFYLVMSMGGALAGLCATVLFPQLLTRSYEFFAAAFVLWLVGFSQRMTALAPVMRIAVCASLALPPTWMIHQRSLAERIPSTRVTHVRNYYGTMTIADSLFLTSVSSDTTLHGVQMKGDDSRRPTTYYTHGSGLGIVLDGLQSTARPLRIGVIGLGAGTVAAYVRQQDEIVFWEINPLSEKIAREQFTFLKECPGRSEVRLQDGRLGLRNDPGHFDVLLVDAFSGDSIPPHLLTTNAIGEYIARLPDGFLVVHISNRYFDLLPVLVGGAQKAGRRIVSVSASPSPASNENAHATPTLYAIIYPPSRKPALDSWASRALQSEEVTYRLANADDIPPIEWTDERHAIIEALRK